MPLSCRCSHHISIRITNSEFSRIFTKTESFGITNQTKIHNSFLMIRCGDQQKLQKICNPCPAIVRLSLNSTPDNLFIRGLLIATFFLSIFIGNLLCCWNPFYDNYAWCYLVHSNKGRCWTLPPQYCRKFLELGGGGSIFRFECTLVHALKSS